MPVAFDGNLDRHRSQQFLAAPRAQETFNGTVRPARGRWSSSQTRSRVAVFDSSVDPIVSSMLSMFDLLVVVAEQGRERRRDERRRVIDGCSPAKTLSNATASCSFTFAVPRT